MALEVDDDYYAPDMTEYEEELRKKLREGAKKWDKK